MKNTTDLTTCNLNTFNTQIKELADDPYCSSINYTLEPVSLLLKIYIQFYDNRTKKMEIEKES